MSLPNLEIAPHEAGDLAPGEPLCAPATHRLASKKYPGHVYLARRVRTESGPDAEYIWVARRESVLDAPLLRCERNTSDLKQLFANFMRGKFERRLFFARDFRLASTRDWHFSLWLSELRGSSWLFAADRKLHPQHDSLYLPWFRWPHLAEGELLSRQWRADIPNKQLEKEVGAMLRDADSDGSFTYRWLQLGAREREALLFPKSREEFANFEQLLHWILQADDRWEAAVNWTWVINLTPSTDTPLYAETVAHNSGIYSDARISALPNRLRRLLQLAVKHFELSFNKAYAETTVFKTIWNLNYGQWQITVSIPTAHEQLEAHLQLRDWLQGKVTPAELAELMS